MMMMMMMTVVEVMVLRVTTILIPAHAFEHDV